MFYHICTFVILVMYSKMLCKLYCLIKKKRFCLSCDFHRVWPFFFSTNFPLWEQFDAVCWSWCGWCEPCNPATLPQCPRLSLSGLPTPPPPSCGVLSEGQLLWTQTTVPFVLPGLGMHSAIFSCVSASPTGCQTCGPYSYASSSLSFAFFHSVCLSLWQCQCLSHWWRVLRRDHLCGYVIVNLSHCVRCNQSTCFWRVFYSTAVNESLGQINKQKKICRSLLLILICFHLTRVY